MSVLMTLTFEADGDAFERYAQSNADTMRAISGAGKEAGAIHHAFHASDAGVVMVVDEWESAEAFQGFFEAQGEQIGGLMAAAGVTAPPTITFWRKLDTGDEF